MKLLLPKTLAKFLLLTSLFLAQLGFAQTDDFTDGNFSASPVWSGNTSNFSIETSSPYVTGGASTDGFYLASSTSVGNITLTTPSTEVTEWKFSWGSGDFSPATSNYFGIILMSSAPITGNITGTSWSGYFLKIGNSSPDPIELWKKNGAGSGTKVGSFATSPDFDSHALQNGLNIRVTRNSSGKFELFYSTGFTYASTPATSAGTLTDNAVTTSSYFGVFSVFANPSASRRFFFDNLVLGAPPTAAPVVTGGTVNGNVGAAITNYQINATNAPTSYAIVTGTLPAGLSFNTDSGVISGTPTTFGSSSIAVTATNAIGTSSPAATIAFNISKGNQTITFAALANKQYGDAAFNLTGTASSSLVVSYTSSDTNVATVSGNTVTIVGMGSTNITASQAGDTNYNAASNVVRSLTVTAKALTITGLTANNKIQDGNTTATLSGTATLNGIIGSDDVTLTGTPTATFATSNVGTGIAVTVTGYSLTGANAGNYTVSQPTGLTANITALGVPVATAATSIDSDGFTANWNAVTGATSYILNVYQKSGGGTVTKLTENFDLFAAGAPNGIPGPGTNDRSTTLNTYTQTPGWTGAKVYEAGGTAKMGTGGAMGILTTPTLDLSDDGGNFKIDFEAMAWSGDVTQLKIYLDDVLVQTVTGLNNSTYTLSPFSFNLTGGTSSSILSIRGNVASGSRFFLENLVVTQGGVTLTNVAGSPFTINAPVTSHTVTGLDPENLYYYTVQAVVGGNTSAYSNEIDVTTEESSVIWNGTAWSNITGPTPALNAIIEGVYNTATNSTTDGFAAKSLTINSGSITIASGDTVTITNGLNNTLTATAVIVENNGNLIQAGTTNQNSGNITVKRNTANLMLQDYVLWSSPTAGTQTLLNFSPATLTNRFYTFNGALGTAGQFAAVSPSTTTFSAANGYLIRMPSNHPTSPTSWEGTFTGVPNNGDISVASTSGNFTAVGNPYPSTIDADQFIIDNAIGNSDLNSGDGLYFWRKTNNVNQATNPTASYATYTTAGGIKSGGDSLEIVPNGMIQVGQGFIVKATSSSLNFNNGQRIDNHGNQFLRNATVERHRIWLNLSNATGSINQMMVAYMTDATQGIDAAIDARYLNDSPTALNSLVNNEAFAIQGRSLPFEASDVVPMQFKAAIAGTYTIAIDHVDGLFSDSQDIFLRDTATGVEHDLKSSSYTFASEIGTFANRFEIVFTAALSTNNPTLDANSVVIYKNDNQSFVINTGNTTMSSVKVFDIRGRLLTSVNNINATQTIVTAGQSNEVLLVQVTSVEGATVTKKVVR